MIHTYYRPATLDDALRLLSNPKEEIYPMGGGTVLARPQKRSFAVVDLQSLGLDRIEKKGKTLDIGATATLQAVLDAAGDQPALVEACRREASHNLRQAATIAGTLVNADGRSSLATLLLAMDAHLIFLPANEEMSLGDWLPLRKERQPGRLITSIRIPLNIQAGFNMVARTPADQPLVCAAVAGWTSGRTRVALGGCGAAPLMVMDGTHEDRADLAAQNAFAQADDEWASAAYRQNVAARLVMRLLADLKAE